MIFGVEKKQWLLFMFIDYANMIGRSPSALNMKIGNIGRLDPELKKKDITGLTHGAKME